VIGGDDISADNPYIYRTACGLALFPPQIEISSRQIDERISLPISSRQIDETISIADFFPPN
jgi:hypothetical protein